MVHRLITRWGLALGLVASSAPVRAAEIRGELAVEPVLIDVSEVPPLPSHTQIRVAQPARGFRSRLPELALFLEVENSLPLPAAAQPAAIRVRGFELSPAVTSCPVDGKLTFISEGARAFDLVIGGKPIGRLEPGGTLEWVCETGPEGAAKLAITVPSHTFMSGYVYVGEVGVAARPDSEGRFRLSAPAGTYRLLVVTERGVENAGAVKVGERDVDLGTLSVGASVP